MAGMVCQRGKARQAILCFRDPNQSGKLVQFTVTRATKREAENALAELALKRSSRVTGSLAVLWNTASQLADASLSHKWLNRHVRYRLPHYGASGLPSAGRA